MGVRGAEIKLLAKENHRHKCKINVKSSWQRLITIISSSNSSNYYYDVRKSICSLLILQFALKPLDI